MKVCFTAISSSCCSDTSVVPAAWCTLFSERLIVKALNEQQEMESRTILICREAEEHTLFGFFVFVFKFGGHDKWNAFTIFLQALR